MGKCVGSSCSGCWEDKVSSGIRKIFITMYLTYERSKVVPNDMPVKRISKVNYDIKTTKQLKELLTVGGNSVLPSL
jgi:hypothetical protein